MNKQIYTLVRFKTPTGWRRFFLRTESLTDDVLKKIQDKFNAEEFVIESEPLAEPENAVYQEDL